MMNDINVHKNSRNVEQLYQEIFGKESKDLRNPAIDIEDSI